MRIINRIAKRISDYNRLKKYNFFINYFEPISNAKILDVGASEKEYQKNANILEKKYPYPENITVLGVDDFKEFFMNYPKVKVLTYKDDVFPFRDKEFDICWSNAVLEHVGDREKQEKFLKEVRRVAKAAYITTPNKYFPFEIHTRIPLLHYLPKRIFDKILIKIGKSWATGDYMNLLSLKDIRKLLAKCNISEYKIIKNRILFFTVNFIIIF